MIEKITMSLTKREARLIMAIRNLKFGEIIIDVRDGTPQQRIRQWEKQIDLDKIPLDKNFEESIIR